MSFIRFFLNNGFSIIGLVIIASVYLASTSRGNSEPNDHTPTKQAALPEASSESQLLAVPPTQVDATANKPSITPTALEREEAEKQPTEIAQPSSNTKATNQTDVLANAIANTLTSEVKSAAPEMNKAEESTAVHSQPEVTTANLSPELQAVAKLINLDQLKSYANHDAAWQAARTAWLNTELSQATQLYVALAFTTRHPVVMDELAGLLWLQGEKHWAQQAWLESGRAALEQGDIKRATQLAERLKTLSFSTSQSIKQLTEQLTDKKQQDLAPIASFDVPVSIELTEHPIQLSSELSQLKSQVNFDLLKNQDSLEDTWQAARQLAFAQEFDAAIGLYLALAFKTANPILLDEFAGLLLLSGQPTYANQAWLLAADQWLAADQKTMAEQLATRLMPLMPSTANAIMEKANPKPVQQQSIAQPTAMSVADQTTKTAIAPELPTNKPTQPEATTKTIASAVTPPATPAPVETTPQATVETQSPSATASPTTTKATDNTIDLSQYNEYAELAKQIDFSILSAYGNINQAWLAARQALLNQQWQQAQDLYLALAFKTRHPDIIGELGNLLLATGQQEWAEKAWLESARTLIAQNKPHKAAQLADYLANTSRSTSEAIAKLLNPTTETEASEEEILISHQPTENALKAFESQIDYQVLTPFRNFNEAWQAARQAWLDQKWAEAQKLYIALAFKTRQPDVIGELGNLLLITGHTQWAEIAWIESGRALIAQGKPQKAQLLAQRLQATSPKAAQGILNLLAQLR